MSLVKMYPCNVYAKSNTRISERKLKILKKGHNWNLKLFLNQFYNLFEIIMW